MECDKILNYFIDCIDTERRESFSIPEGSKSTVPMSDQLDVVDFFSSDEKFLEFEGSADFLNFWEVKNKYHKQDKVYIFWNYTVSKEGRRVCWNPLYTVEILIEKPDKMFRISKLDKEPTFNISLLSGGLSIHEQFDLLDTISDESSWDEKVKIFMGSCGSRIKTSLVDQTHIFLGNICYSAVTNVARELAWINSKHSKSIPQTSLSFLVEENSTLNSDISWAGDYIEILPMNKIQKEVVNYSLNNSFTVITGPPGTGKSQVVINLLANIAFNGKTVLFASKNNKAINTVTEKMEEIQSGYCPFVRLGNNNEKKKGLQKIIDNLERTEKKTRPNFTSKEVEFIAEEINRLHIKLEESESIFKEYWRTQALFQKKKKELPENLVNLFNDSSFMGGIEKKKEICRSMISSVQIEVKKFEELKRQYHAEKTRIKVFEQEISQNILKFPMEFRHFFEKGQKVNIHPFWKKDVLNYRREFEKEFNRFKTRERLLKQLKKNCKEFSINLQLAIDSLKQFADLITEKDLRILLKSHEDKMGSTILSSPSELILLKTELKNRAEKQNGFLCRLYHLLTTISFRKRTFNQLISLLKKLPVFLGEYLTLSMGQVSVKNMIRVIESLEVVTEYNAKIGEIQRIRNELTATEERISEVEGKYHDDSWESLRATGEKILSPLPAGLKEKIRPSHEDVFPFCSDLLKKLEPLVFLILNLSNLRKSLQKSSEKLSDLANKTERESFLGLIQRLKIYLTETQLLFEEPLVGLPVDKELAAYKQELQKLELMLSTLVELKKLKNLSQETEKKLNESLSVKEFENQLVENQEKLQLMSVELFNHSIYAKIYKNKDSFRATIQDFYENWKDNELAKIYKRLVDFLGIFVTTNLSARNNLPNQPGIFDYVIVDEASQNDIASVLPLMFRAKKVILIGDPNQLRHITGLKEKTIAAIANEHLLNGALLDYHYQKRSAFDLASRVFLEITKKGPFVLRNHYRCHQDIIGFSNENFYKMGLFPKSYIKKDIFPLKPGVTLKNVAGNYQQHKNFNEAKSIVDFIEQLYVNKLDSKISIGVITPFSNQKDIIISLLRRCKHPSLSMNSDDHILVSTVHGFQGDERDIIIYSPVMSKGIKPQTLAWLDRSTELLNVAVTRARNSLVIIGDIEFCLTTDGVHRKLMDYCLKKTEKETNQLFESPVERKLFYALERSGLHFDYQVPVGCYRADFILKMNDKYMCLEIDGIQHGKTQSYDYSRDRYFEEHGYDVLRVPAADVENQCNGVIDKLYKICSLNSEVVAENMEQ